MDSVLHGRYLLASVILTENAIETATDDKTSVPRMTRTSVIVQHKVFAYTPHMSTDYSANYAYKYWLLGHSGITSKTTQSHITFH